ncbi:MAG TPA: serine/threonine-protein kinase [Gemmatimonadales bacterium]|nr:serine/threonine-protein kinase [Gemmatimonadales bacterium]
MSTDLLPQLQTAFGDGYRFEKELGGGGMSRVFVATELGLARRVVVKVLAPELAAGVSVDRFRRETQLAASLQHPHIVPLLTAGAAGELLYYTMPLIEGESLRSRLARERELPVRDALRMLRDVADALAYAHGRGLVHRDIKPDNVLLSGGHALVADFGIAKALSQAGGSSGLTSIGVAIGTPTYMAPEQAAGDPNVDHRADLYAFGAMAYEMLAGRPPFAGMSPHQMLAAHVTEPIEPITKHRPQLPRSLAELVMWCLEKNPADRPQTAAELVPALEGMATPTGGTTSVRYGRQRAFPWNKAVAVAGGALLLAAGGWFALRGSGSTTFDTNRVAVAPFDVLDPALALWREGMVDVLSRSLDGAGPLRTVSPTLVVKRWGGRGDVTAAQALGRSTGARTVVYGQLLGAGPDSVRLLATVLDASTGTHEEIELRDQTARVDRLADSLTVAVLRTLGRTRAIGAVRGTPLGSKSLPALKAFLQGEQFLRRSQYDSALYYHQQAIAQDSTFVLALSHASMAAGWQHSAGDTLTRTYALAAGRLNKGLAPRESLIVAADSLMAVGFSGPQFVGGAWWTFGRRLLATLDEAVRRYPTDPELWYTLGDARYHLGVTAGLPPARALEAFDRAIELDSSFSPAYIHAVGLALQLRGPDSARRYAAAFLKVSSGGRYPELYRLFEHLVDPRMAHSAATAAELDSLAPSLSFMMGGVFDRWPDTAETQVRVAGAWTAGRLRKATTAAESTQARQPLAMAQAYRGHLGQAYQDIGPANPFLYAELAILDGVPRDSAGLVLEQLLQTPASGRVGPWTVAWAAARRDTAALLQITRQMEGAIAHLPPNVPPIAKELVGYMIGSSKAFLTLVRGDTTRALTQFLALPDSACFGYCSLDLLQRVELLEARGRHQEALAEIESNSSLLPALPSDVLRTLVRGRLRERLGRREEAAADFNYVVDAWARADSVLQPYVTEARAGLTRLGAERKR